jgi:hypothetical protein
VSKKKDYCVCVMLGLLCLGYVLFSTHLCRFIPKHHSRVKKIARRYCSFALAVGMGSFSTSSGPVPVLRCPVLFNGTNYRD